MHGQGKVMQISIKHGRLIDPANGIDQVMELYIRDGKIAAIGKTPRGFKPDLSLDAKGKLVLPGLVDLSARLGEPGREETATIASETRAATRGGITSVICPPDTAPIIDSTAVVELIHQRAMTQGHGRVYCLGALTHALKGESLARMHALKQEGCIGLSNGLAPISNTAVLRRALDYASSCDMTVHLFCEDQSLRDNGIVHEGIMSVRLGLPGIPGTAESIAISRVLQLIEETACRVHFCRVSSAQSLPMIAEAKSRGLPVTADVGISHLYLTEVDVADFDSNCYLIPPLRGHTDRNALRQGLADGIIDAICSDHQPQNKDAKLVPFSLSEPGASTLDVLLPLGLQLASEGIAQLPAIVRSLTANPAAIAGLETGNLGVDQAADLSIVDPDAGWTVTVDSISSSGKNCPFLGWELHGRVTHTLVAGQLVHGQAET